MSQNVLRNKGSARILGFILALVAFYILHPASAKAVASGTSIIGAISLFYTLLPYTFPSAAIAWFIAFAVLGLFEDVEAKCFEMAYALSALVFVVNWLPIISYVGDLAPVLLFASVLWPLAFLLASEWGNLLAMVGLLFFGAIVGNLLGDALESALKPGRKVGQGKPSSSKMFSLNKGRILPNLSKSIKRAATEFTRLPSGFAEKYCDDLLRLAAVRIENQGTLTPESVQFILSYAFPDTVSDREKREFLDRLANQFGMSQERFARELADELNAAYCHTRSGSATDSFRNLNTFAIYKYW